MERTTKRFFCLLLCLAMMLGLMPIVAFAADTPIAGQYYVAGTGTLCGTDWHPCDPDNAMSKKDNTIWYKTYKNVAPGTYQLRVTDGTWNNSWYDDIPGADYGAGNYVLVIDDYSDVTVLFEYTSERVVVEITASPMDAPTEPTPSIPTTPGTTPVYCQAPDSWTKCYVYWWGGSESISWPGVLMEQYENGVWYYSVPSDLVGMGDGTSYSDYGIIFNNGDSLQTSNLVLPDDGRTEYLYESDLWIIPGSNTTGGDNTGIDNTGSTGTAAVYRVAGNAEWMGNWDPANNQGCLEEIANGVYEKTFRSVQPGNYELKVTRNGSWDECWGDGFNNYCFSVWKTCDIAVTFTLIDGVGTIDLKGDGVANSGSSSDCSHSFTIYMYNLDAKCGVDGTETAMCDRCPETDTRTAPGTALDHAFENGSCIHCGKGADLLGDVTDDGKVNIGDVARLYACVKGRSTLVANADITGDGEVTIIDVARLYACVKGSTENG